MKELKISLNPLSPGFEVFEKIFVLKIGVPYSNSGLNVIIDPNILDYIEEVTSTPKIEIRQLIVSHNIESLEFDFEKKRVNEIMIASDEVGNRKFNITLLDIGDEYVEGIADQMFKYFNFQVEEVI